ncbi:uncharacterized protein LOC115956869 [Quercus lobata]|uniref:uncharacterized protein LOC115956869 n=1 Tax=Quercus lobata TaxID=97700 RepID=UPI0012473C10|nr:uncharacterized protein LOC115956869 [Quercus lobata]
MGPRMYKINFNGLKFEDQRASGIGVVMQDLSLQLCPRNCEDETGFVIAALSKKLQDLRGTDEIEALVVETADQLTWEVGLQTAELEEDSMTRFRRMKIWNVVWEGNGSRLVSLSCQKREEPCCLYYGFGYDPTTDDYILVRVLYLEEEEGDDLKNDQLMVQIYTLGTGTWRNVTNPGPGSLSAFPENHLSVFVNGAVHWITSIEDDYIIYVILSFDRRNNSFHEMALPGSLDDVNKLNIKVAVVGFTKIGEVLVINTVNGELLSYNPSSQQISYIDIPAQLAPFYLDTYMESLPLLNVQDCASARRANELNLSNASKGKRKIC